MVKSYIKNLLTKVKTIGRNDKVEIQIRFNAQDKVEIHLKKSTLRELIKMLEAAESNAKD